MDAHIRLDDETSRTVDGLIEAGRFETPEAVVREGVRLVGQKEAYAASVLASINAGIADAEAGRVTPIDEAFDELETFIEEQLRSRHV